MLKQRKRYWGSDKDVARLEKSRQDWEDLLDLANARLKGPKRDDRWDLSRKCARLITREESEGTFQDFLYKLLPFAKGLSKDATPEEAEKAEALLSAVQAHIRLRLEQIRSAAALGRGGTLWETKGVRRVVADDDLDRLSEEFEPEIFEAENDLDLFQIRLILDTRIADSTRDQNLKPSRIQKCEKCEQYYYQPTARKKIYCSMLCAKAVSQARYAKRKAK